MAFDGLLITEIFYSLQGETSHAGLPYIFIRLTGCNLRCSYCDSTYAYKNGQKMSLNEVLAQLKKWNCKNVLLTGGEPLLQRGTLPLIQKLRALGYEVSIETHGEQSIEIYKSLARIVMDIKTPGSKMNREGWIKNLPHLKAEDEVKFVITSWEDYNFAKKILKEFKFNTQNILFSPVVYNKHSPLKVPEFDSTLLAEKILEDQLPIRMQLQLHKILWGTEKTGV